MLIYQKHAFGCSLHVPTCVVKVWNAFENREDEQILKDIIGKTVHVLKSDHISARVAIMTVLVTVF